MKLRYTPLQTAVEAVEETHRDALEGAHLRQVPVVCAPLHSMLGPVAAGAKRAGKDVRVVYVMTDGAALPGAFSRLVTELRLAGLLDAWVTCGQAFGGELEAVTIWSGLQAHTCTLKEKPLGTPASASSFLALSGLYSKSSLTLAGIASRGS